MEDFAEGAVAFYHAIGRIISIGETMVCLLINRHTGYNLPDYRDFSVPA
jgi:hypothetical protein